jgi:hypothetical protein
MASLDLTAKYSKWEKIEVVCFGTVSVLRRRLRGCGQRLRRRGPWVVRHIRGLCWEAASCRRRLDLCAATHPVCAYDFC